jgi:hypothetical protein
LEVTLKPGKSVTQVYRIQNQGDDTIVTAQVLPFEPDGEQGNIKISQTPSTVLSYFSLLNADLQSQGPGHLATFPLKGGEAQELVLKINIPNNAVNGDHYLTLLLNADTEHLLFASGSKSYGSLGTNILLTIADSEVTNQTVKIEELNLQGRTLKVLGLTIVDSFADFDFLIRVKNTSNHFFKVIGHLTITNTFGRSLTTIALREDNILSGTTRKLVGTVPTYWEPVFPLGRFTANLSITPENSTNTVSQAITFLVFPYKAILALGLVALFYYLYFHRSFQKAKVKLYN